MNLWNILTGKWWGVVIDGGKWLLERITEHQSRADTLRNARLEVELAQAQADKELAVYKARSDIEWDLKWAEAATRSWKDEFLLLMWSLPLICLFIPPLRPFVIEGFDYLKDYSPDAPQLYLGGWVVIFAATFGLREALKFMLPGKFAQMITAMGGVDNDVPDAAIKAIDARVQQQQKAK